jgi:sulfonate transport system substrate-binding protein
MRRRADMLSRRGFGLGGLAAVATARAARAADLSGVTLRVGDQVSYYQSKLKFAGLLDDIPYKIEWAVFPAAVQLHEALKAGAIDVGGSNDSPMVSAFAGGSTAVAVSAWSNGGRGTYLLVPKSSPAQTVSDLRGKTICPTTRGSVAHYLIVGALKQAGVPLDSVNLAFLNPVDAGAAFAAGSIDAWATWGIYAARVRGQLGARTISDGSGINSGYYVYAATPEAVADAGKLAAIADFSSRVDRSYAWSRANPAAHNAWFRGFSRQDEDIAAALYPDESQYRRLPLDDAFADRLRLTYETWLSVGLLKPGLDLNAHVFRGLPAG